LDGRQAAGGASREKNDWIVQVIPQQAIKAMPVLFTTPVRIFSLFSQTCCFLLGHLLVVAALGLEPVPLVCGLHSST
jgi:hypothetical protein